MQLERAFQVTGLVLVDDVVLGQLVQHRRYLGQQRFGSALLAGVAQRLHRIARRLVIETVVRLVTVWRIRFLDDLWFAIISFFYFISLFVNK